MRGVHVALYDYAIRNQEMLGNESIIFHDGISEKNDASVIEKFRRNFEVIPYQDFDSLGKISEKMGLDAIYIIKSGELDFQVVNEVPNLIHAVFPQKICEVHGKVYAFVSEWLSRECSNSKIPFVPHMITMPQPGEDLREQLNIPKQATVFGCYGGSDSFNLDFVHKTICDIVEKSKDCFFIFMNISPFARHEKIIFLPGISDSDYKAKFISTCDAMIHARAIGESFGLACGEFSVSNKPVITYALSPQRSHIDILGNKALLYKGPTDLRNIILDFDKTWAAKQNWDCYSDKFSPGPVMSKFREVFLEADTRTAAPEKITLQDKCMIQYFRARKKLRNFSKKLYS